jgi:hypothetical protein
MLSPFDAFRSADQDTKCDHVGMIRSIVNTDARANAFEDCRIGFSTSVRGPQNETALKSRDILTEFRRFPGRKKTPSGQKAFRDIPISIWSPSTESVSRCGSG